MDSEVINSNPTVYDVSAFSKRDSADDAILKLVTNDISLTNLSLFSVFEFTENPLGLSDSDDSASVLSFDDLSLKEGRNDDDGFYINNGYNTDDETEEKIDSKDIYDLIASISDPEHPLTLAQLAVVQLQEIQVINGKSEGDIAEVVIRITPTITHCSLATLIGLGIRVRLERSLPPQYRITILLKEGTHQSENQVNKQLNDKERVCAACENDQLLKVISKMLSTCV
ncbi:iron-sulfur cluster assembly protein CIA2 ASCRUDRAFT_78038 [Ascoidea rubescens DSM 1968]|uniref:Uncharacterized protein n=1 Tax=Ascoidea rubescens DSM 1968 TaxID=1344418 RepID=A0A1D2VAA4_9ASCO|nr:hypothetical protein ASCRUDRAFT_78038 [Ascoidea rubescens DSM 1968]ODV58353.1 hypothetical protein ASCRUDRAFT_78038 [Ascoidea rubescens DSM 1968]